MADVLREDRDNFYNNSKPARKGEKLYNGTVSIARVFGYVFIGLFITAGVMFGLGAALFYSGAYKNNNLMFGILISAAILTVVDVIAMSFMSTRGKISRALIPMIIYAVLVGITFAGLTIYIDWRILGTAFGITCGVFGLMSLVAFLTKGNLSPLLLIGLGIGLGGAVLALFNFLFLPLTSMSGAFITISWIVSFAIFAMLMFVTIFDLWNLKKIEEAGALSNDLAIFCAFNIYVDFINIFIRILYFLILIFGVNRN